MEKKEEKVQERSTKSKVMTVMLGIAFFCILSLLLLAIFDDGTIFGGRDSEKPTEQEPQKLLRSSIYSTECGNDKEETFNGYTISFATQVEETNVGCVTNSVKINGTDLTNKLIGDTYGVIDEYAFFGDYLLFKLGLGSGFDFGIYNLKTGDVKLYDSTYFEGFAFDEWTTDDNGIYFNECINNKGQYLSEDDPNFNKHNMDTADFKIEYKDGSFSKPIFVKEYGNPYATP